MDHAPWTTDADKFFAMAIASKLIGTEELRNACCTFLAESHAFSTAAGNLDGFCNFLIRHHNFTKWQCDKLRNGQWKGFFLDGFKFLQPVGRLTYAAEDTRTKRRVTLLLKPLWPNSTRIEYKVVEGAEDERTIG